MNTFTGFGMMTGSKRLRFWMARVQAELNAPKRVVADADTPQSCSPPGHRAVPDDVLAQSDLHLVSPKAIRSENKGAPDVARLVSSLATVEAVRSANVAKIFRANPGILSRNFGLNDLKLVVTAKRHGQPIITTNSRLKNQITGAAERSALFGDVKILVPGVDFTDAASLKAILGL